MQDTLTIVGAGIGGLTAALALQQAGRRVRVCEQVLQLGEVGAGLTLSPNATRVLIGLGLEAPLRAQAIAPDVQIIQHYRTGGELVRVTRGDVTEKRYGAPYWQIHRADLHATLADAVRSRDPDCLQLGRQLVDFEQQAGGVTLHFLGGQRETCAGLIGADGIRSLVRNRLFGDAAHPTLPFLGQGANLAIEDALVLARALQATSDIPGALVRYEGARAERAERVMQGSVAAVENYLSATPESFDAQQLINEETLGLFAYDAATVAI